MNKTKISETWIVGLFAGAAALLPVLSHAAVSAVTAVSLVA
jgi:hypothetical protein